MKNIGTSQQTRLQCVESLMNTGEMFCDWESEPNAPEVGLAIEQLKSHRSPATDQIPAELIKAGSKTIHCEIHELIISIWNKEELPGEWKKSIIVPIYKKGDKTDCSNYRGISLLPTTYNILNSILLSRLTQYAEDIIWDH